MKKRNEYEIRAEIIVKQLKAKIYELEAKALDAKLDAKSGLEELERKLKSLKNQREKLDQKFEDQVRKVNDLILSEVNIKEIEYLTDASGILVKKIKPNFKTLGPKYGKLMKQIAAAVNQLNQEDIATALYLLFARQSAWPSVLVFLLIF